MRHTITATITMNKLYLRLYPLNEGQELNYVEGNYYFTLDTLVTRCTQLQQDLTKALPQATITVKIENQNCTREWFFDNGQITDSEGNTKPINALNLIEELNAKLLPLNTLKVI